MPGFQSDPPLYRRGERRAGRDASITESVSGPTPALSARGTSSSGGTSDPARSFNPPPALSARGTRIVAQLGIGSVSIHPPLYRRGEPGAARRQDQSRRFQSTPAFGEGNGTDDERLPSGGFNPPPLSARGTRSTGRSSSGSPRFNPPPALLARGTLSWSCCDVLEFQSTPRFIGEGNNRTLRALDLRRFNPPPASSARGTSR